MLLYSLVSKKGVVVESNDVYSPSFSLVTRRILKQINVLTAEGARKSYLYSSNFIHYFVDNGTVFMVITETTTEPGLAFEFLQDIANEWKHSHILVNSVVNSPQYQGAIEAFQTLLNKKMEYYSQLGYDIGNRAKEDVDVPFFETIADADIETGLHHFSEDRHYKKDKLLKEGDPLLPVSRLSSTSEQTCFVARCVSALTRALKTTTFDFSACLAEMAPPGVARLHDVDRVLEALDLPAKDHIDMDGETAFLLLTTFLAHLPSPLLVGVQDELAFTNARVSPLAICMQMVSPVHIATTAAFVSLLGSAASQSADILNLAVTRTFSLFFATKDPRDPPLILVKILKTLIVEHARIFSAMPPDDPVLLPGEEIAFGPIAHVKMQIAEPAANASDAGIHPTLGHVRLWVTNYRITYRAWERETQDAVELEGIELSSIFSLKKAGRYQRVVSKHCKAAFFGFLSRHDDELFVSIVSKMAFHKPIKSLFSFSNFENNDSPLKIGRSRNTHLSTNNRGWNVFNSSEYTRMNIDKTTWRITQINAQHDICATYPTFFAVPMSIPDNFVKELAAFRINKRFPIVSWCSATVFLVIAHQPRLDSLVAATAQAASSTEDMDSYDAILMDELHNIANRATTGVNFSAAPVMPAQPPRKRGEPKSPSRTPLTVFETGIAPKKITYETYYPQCRFVHLGLDTADLVRANYARLVDLCTSSAPTDAGKQRWLSSLAATEWLGSVCSTLRASLRVAEMLMSGRSSIIQSGEGHESDELLVSSLAQLVLDPFYRTFRGLQVLVQKEWCAFGYAFGAQFKANSQGPVGFVLFCDAVIQLIHQYPTDFEFNEAAILFLCEQSFNGRYGTFLIQNHKDSESLNLHNTTKPVWSALSASIDRYLNPFYKAYSLSALPIKQFNYDNLYFWSEFYTRWTTAPTRTGAMRSVKVQAESVPADKRMVELNLNGMGLFDVPPTLLHLGASVANNLVNSLRLADNLLSTIPRAVLRLSGLRELILDNNLIYHLPPLLWMLLNERIRSLEHISIASNFLTVIPREIGQFTTLQRLVLSDNRITSVTPYITKLAGLVHLDLGGNVLDAFPMELINVTSLTSLQLARNHIESLPSLLSELVNLRVLGLRENKITKIPTTLSNLRQLRSLDLSANQLSNIAPLCTITSIEELVLDANLIADIPAAIGRMSSLTSLSMQHNRVQQVPEELMTLRGLISLNLSHNQLAWLPPTVSALVSLQRLSLANNQLDTLPQSLALMTALASLDVAGNKLSQVQHLASAGDARAILALMKEDVEGFARSLRAKVVFVGQQSKTSARITSTLAASVFHIRRSNTISAPPSRGSFLDLSASGSSSAANATPANPGVEIDCVSMPMPSEAGGDTVDISVWNFSPSEAMWQHIPLLFSDKSIYVVQFGFSPLEQSPALDYWLNTICHKYASVKIFAVGLLTAPQSEASLHTWLAGWKSSNKHKIYITRQIEFIFVSELDDIESLRQRILLSLPSKTAMNEMVPSPFFLLEKYLGEKRLVKPVLTSEDIVEMAAIYNIRGRAKIAHLVRFLETSGAILQFPNDYHLTDIVVLNSQWLAQTFGHLVAAGAKNGVVRPCDLASVWPSTFVHESMFERMINLCYRFDIISFAISQSSGPLPVTSVMPGDSSVILVNQFIDSSVSFSPVDWLNTNLSGDAIKLVRCVQFTHGLPVQLFSMLKCRIAQVTRIEREARLAATFVAIQDSLATRVAAADLYTAPVKLLVEQVSDSRIVFTVVASARRIFVAQDLLGKAMGVMEAFTKNILVSNKSRILIPCPHCSDKDAHFSLERTELAVLFGRASMPCPADPATQVSVANISPDLSMRYFQGAIIDHSNIVYGDELGRGGHGVVYKGRYNDRDVAIKRLISDEDRAEIVETDSLRPDDHMDMIESLRSFLREAYTSEHLQTDKHTIKLVGLVLFPLCLVTEFATHGDLGSFINQHRPLASPIRLRIALDVAIGMAEMNAHLPPIHHNDLKPPNILLCSDPSVIDLSGSSSPLTVIADLGTVRDSFGARIDGRLVDNPIYLAPEVMRNQWYTQQADVYSFGVILWEMISSSGFFSEESFLGGIEAAVSKGQRPPIPSDCDPMYRRLISHCWHQDASKRPSFPQIVETLSEMCGTGTISSSYSPRSPNQLSLSIDGSSTNDISVSPSSSFRGSVYSDPWKGAVIGSGTKLRITPYLKSHADK
eukprot:gene6574-7630_t